jgi:malate dehydrogenase (oxaloacetate-decarboxylating)
MQNEKDIFEIHSRKHGKVGTELKVPLTPETLPLLYTPGVALISKSIAEDPTLAYEYAGKGNTVAVISDGSAVLGLGNIGPLGALPVMEGKCAIFKALAGIDAVPICLDTQNTEEIIKTVKYLAPVYGAINLEDISAPRCFEIEDRLRKELSIPIMHDDQHGTATVVLAGLINALKLRELSLSEIRVVVSGAGAAGIAIVKMLKNAGVGHITMCDSKGIISASRTDLNEEKKLALKMIGEDRGEGDLTSALSGSHVFIGVSKGNTVTKEMVQSMHERPIIFALANPTPEIMPDLAKEAGAFIVATGRSDFPNQINNALAYPHIFKGALKYRIAQFKDEHFVQCAHALAGIVANPTTEHILPGVFDTEISEALSSVFK